MNSLRNQNPFGPQVQMAKSMVIDRDTERIFEDQDNVFEDENQISVYQESTCNTSVGREQNSFNFQSDEIGKQIEEIDLQSTYIKDEEFIEEGVLKPIQYLEFNSFKTKEQAELFLKSWNQNTHYSKNEPRTKDAHKEGGKKCYDKLLVSTLRSVAREVIKQIGKKILTGDFNLTTISFPIRAMIGKSALECVLNSTCYYPLFINLASQNENPVDRIKLVVTAVIASFPIGNSFYKPLNPILGETFQGCYIDGTKLYAEQISHHPPISYLYVVGPNNKYISYGYCDFNASAGLNSLKIKNNGKRYVKFPDGQLIIFNSGNEYFSGTMFGRTKHETLGDIQFVDKANDIVCTLKIGKVKKRPTDFLEGEIKVTGKVVSRVFGSYLGFLDFDGVRYWDVKHHLPYKNYIKKSNLYSDHSHRQDKYNLNYGNINQAQIEKQTLEQIQREDQNLRKEFQKEIYRKRAVHTQIK